MEEKLYTEVNQCRVCGFKNLTPVLTLGDLYVTDFVNSDADPTYRSPLDVVLCNKSDGGCGLLQLRHTFSPEHMYRQYWYRSGINDTMKNALRSITQAAESMVDLNPGDYVIDIGSNDSTLLRSYSKDGINRVGFEPAKNLMQYAEPGVTKIVNDFFGYAAWAKNFPAKKAKVITAIAMFYDLDKPNDFIADIVTCLDDDGLFIVQQNYLPFMLERNVFDNISHEHLEYYSLLSFTSLLDRHNLEVCDIELNDVNGGSMRTYIRHKGRGKNIHLDSGAPERVRDVVVSESNIALNQKKPYEEFAARVNAIKDALSNFIRGEVQKGKKIYVYGASTRGNTLLQFCNLNRDMIIAAAERNPDKWGRKTVGTLIPIVSEDEARKAKPDYFLILPWQFLDEFIEREADYLATGGKFIVPLPGFEVIGGK